jgi:hypothetical protein
VTPWYRDRGALAFIGARYLPALGGLSLLWEIAQLPLYTIWRQASGPYIAFAVVHCTIGDVLIGAAALGIALVLTSAGALGSWRWARIGLLAVLVGLAYTAASEWLNTARGAWLYSALMPRLELGAGAIGLSPLAQWLVVPLAALRLSRTKRR